MSDTYSYSEQKGFRWYYSGSVSGFGVIPIQDSNSGWTHMSSDIRAGHRNPGWKDAIRHGRNATSAYSCQFTGPDFDRSFVSVAENTLVTNKVSGQLVESRFASIGALLSYGGQPGTPAAPASTVTDVHNRCISRFIDSCNSAQSSNVKFGETLQFFEHDVRSILNPMKSLREQIHSYLSTIEKLPFGKQLYKKRRRVLLNTISSAYLEFKFGVEPFVSDITDIVVEAAIRNGRRNPSVPVRARAKSVYSGSIVTTAVSELASIFPDYNFRQDCKYTSTYSEQMKGACSVSTDDNGRIGVGQGLNLLPNSWLPTIWDVLPYTWMVNYFVNVREIIEAMSFQTSDVLWGSWTCRDESKAEFMNVRPLKTPDKVFTTPSQNVNWSLDYSGGNATFTTVFLDRFILTPSALLPSVEYKFPTKAQPWSFMMAAFAPRLRELSHKLLKE